jgi:hypothetical protein
VKVISSVGYIASMMNMVVAKYKLGRMRGEGVVIKPFCLISEITEMTLFIFCLILKHHIHFRAFLMLSVLLHEEKVMSGSELRHIIESEFNFLHYYRIHSWLYTFLH